MKVERIDPRVSFLFVALLSMGGVFLRGALELLPVLASALVGAVCARAPVGRVLRRLAGLWVMLVFVAAMQALFSKDIITGLLAGAAVLQRLVILMLGGAVLAAYPGHALLQGMQQLGLPYRLVFMVSAGLRFVPQFGESYKRSLMVMQLRGADFGRITLPARIKLYAGLLLPTIASGITRAETMSAAMELRGFGMYEKRSSHAPLRMRGRDWFALAGVFFWATGIILWRLFI